MTDLTGRRRVRREWGALALLCGAFAAALLTAIAYWPGLMTWDPVRQYGEALSGEIDDWHPPAMQWVWQQAIRLHPGPMPMLILQLALYWGGLTGIAAIVWSRGRRRLAWAVLACGLWPLGLALTGMILKDCLMAGALLGATALLAVHQGRGDQAWRSRAGIAAGAGAIALLFFAATLRFNAFTACLPLLIALLPHRWWHDWRRLLVTSAIAGAVLLATMPIVNRLIGAKPSGVALSLVIFDLGGITEHSGHNMFPKDLAVADPVRVNHRCYRPNKWDSYSDWVEPECPLGFTAWNDNVDPAEVGPYSFLLQAILQHPIAYAEHRLTHFAINTRILPLADAVERPVPHESAPNPWGFSARHNGATWVIDALAMATAHTPLGWPIVWIGVAAGALMAGWGRPGAQLTVPIALSSVLYGCGYVVFSVAAELRYHLWTELAALLALVLVLGDAHQIGRRRLVWATVPAILAIAAGSVARMIVA